MVFLLISCFLPPAHPVVWLFISYTTVSGPPPFPIQGTFFYFFFHSYHLSLGSLPLLQPYWWLPWMFPLKKNSQNFEERLSFSCLASLGITREQRGYGNGTLRRVVERRKNNNIYITDGLGRWIGSEGPFGDKPALNFTRKYPQIHKETHRHWLGISSFSTVGRYGWPALLLRMGPVFCFLFFCFFPTQYTNQNIHTFFLS